MSIHTMEIDAVYIIVAGHRGWQVTERKTGYRDKTFHFSDKAALLQWAV